MSASTPAEGMPPPQRAAAPAFAHAVAEPLEARQLFAANGSIKGIIFLDGDGNGLKHRREQPMQGITVFLDTNQTGTFEDGEPTTVTNKKGQFAFKKLARTTYNVRDVRPAGFDFTAPVGGAWFVDLRFKKNVAKRDFGYWPLSAGPKPDFSRPVVNPEPPVNIVLYNTGATIANSVDGTSPGGLLSGGPGEGPDPYWAVERLDPGGEPLPFEPTYYSFNAARYNGDIQPLSPAVDSTWIAPTPTATEPLPATRYAYATAFDLTGLEPQSAEMTGIVDADDRLEDIRLNGISLGIGGIRGQATPFALTKGFVAGINTLEFIVANDGDFNGGTTVANPTGIRVDGLRGTAKRIAPGAITLFNTGVFAPNAADGSNNSVLGTGGVDGHYLVSMPGDGFAFYADDTAHKFIFNNILTNGKYGAPFAARDSQVWDNTDLNLASPGNDSTFINPVGHGNAPLPAGTYIYRTWFDLTGVNSSTARITGTMMADDGVVEVYINGNPTGQTQSGADPRFDPEKPFFIDRGMVSGLNVLDFVVTNTDAEPGFSGLRIDNLKGSAIGNGPQPLRANQLQLPLPSFPPLQLPPTFTA